MSIASRTTLTGSLHELMNGILEIEGQVDDALTLYRWRPRTPQLPAIWHWIQPSRLTQEDTARFRDNLLITTTIGIPHGDENEVMADLERYSDEYRDVIDKALHTKAPLGAKWAKRQSMNTSITTFGDQMQVFGIDFPIEYQLDRFIPSG